MQPIPEDILRQFNAVLEQKKIPSSAQNDYRKWLLYYLDFRAKYPPPDSRSEQVRLFVEKARSKGTSGKSLQQAANALSLFFQSQGRSKQAVAQTEKVPEMLASLPARSNASAAVVPQSSPAPSAAVVGHISGRRGGRKYDEWWCLEKTQSPEWDGIIEKLSGEIKARHYSRKTLKAYAEWSRKFQFYLKSKQPDRLSPEDVKAYLTHLAVKCKVSASTQSRVKPILS